MALEAMLAQRHPESDFVFHKKEGSRWTAIHDSFSALVRRCGLQADPPFTIARHTLRHAFASLLAIAGAPLRAIQKLKFHRDDREIRPSEWGGPFYGGADLPSSGKQHEIEV